MTSLTLHGRIHLSSDDKISSSKLVACPEDRTWVPVEGCRKCPRCTSADETSVTCDHPTTAPIERERAPIAEVMDGNVLTVDGGATVESVRRAMDEHGAPVAVVVDACRDPIGVCSRRDLAACAPCCRVDTRMTPFVISMLDCATVADAFAVIVEHDLHHIPVLSAGRVVGLVTPAAVLRWITRDQERSARASDTEGDRHG